MPSGLKDPVQIDKHGSDITLLIAVITGRMTPSHTPLPLLTLRQKSRGSMAPSSKNLVDSHITRNIFQVSSGPGEAHRLLFW